ncbi:ATP-binding protein [Bradyrhizobium sp. Leo170]|uniref:PAS domain-containing sensor histidine kinase n=1 Tax=Bradyrhizobium sp. Leo170 TaxID=1571199 RepID=UPI00102EB46C|nr:ATP-binding protein [Bradyrhizobium sp. Leo170]TAI62482.1 PAS domain-containing sensor histidine kinase [Bradyrhizobium sp. Leo170]
MDDNATSPTTVTSRTSLILSVAITIGIFIFDAITPADSVISTLFVAVVLLSSRFLQTREIVLVSLGCMALSVLAHFVTPYGDSWATISISNRVLSPAAIGVVTFLAVQSRSQEMMLREQAGLLDLTHDTIFVRDMKDVITYWNHGAEEQYGWKKAQAIGRISHQLMRTIFPVPLEAVMGGLLRTGRWEGELVHTRKDGTQAIVASRWSLQKDVRGVPVATLETNNDISDRKRAEDALRESERRYKSIFRTAGVSIWEEDFSQIKAAIDELRVEGVENFRAYFAAHPEFVRESISCAKVVDVNDATVELFKAQSKDELLHSLDAVFTSETLEAFAGELIAVAEEHPYFSAETILQTLKGDKLTVLLAITFPPRPSNLDRVLVTITDITERKRAEEALHKAQAELAHITRVTTMNALTSSIAHEVSQPLGAIVSNGYAGLRWLDHQPPKLEEARRTFEHIVEDGHRAGEVIGRVRALLKKTAIVRECVDATELIQDTVAVVHGEVLRNGILLRTELAPELPPVMGDRVQVQQVLLNLMMNGIDAMKEVTERPRELRIRSYLDDSGAVAVAVHDTGVGLDPSSVDRLFEAFYTTKPEGMGMGLAICRSIVLAHGGRLGASPNEPCGAVFEFSLPPERDETAGAANARPMPLL